MKTIMDAVNELRGDIKNSFKTKFGRNNIFYNEDGFFFASNLNKMQVPHHYVCTAEEFKELISRMENWRKKFERDIELSLFDHNWIVGIIYDSFDTLHEFDIQSLSLRYPENTKAIQVIDLTTMLDSCSSLCQQFECAIIAKLEEERQNV